MAGSCALQMVIGAAAILLQGQASSWNFIPVRESVLPTPDENGTTTLTIVCRANVPLYRCQFNFYSPGDTYLVDLSRGRDSGNVSRHGSLGRFNVGYFGMGLENGHCGAVFTNMAITARIVGCRGANVLGEWNEKTFDMFGESKGAPANNTHNTLVVKPGIHVYHLIRSRASVAVCTIRPPGNLTSLTISRDYVQGAHNDCNRDVGAIPRYGPCGLALSDRSETYNRLTFFNCRTIDSNEIYRFAAATEPPPTTPTRYKVLKVEYSLGESLRAESSITVPLPSQPASSITWTENYTNENGSENVLGDDKWTWPWERLSIPRGTVWPVTHTTVNCPERDL